MKRIKIIGLFIVLCVTVYASTEIKVLTLEQSIALALKQNPGLKISEKEFDKSGAEIWEAYAAILPSIDGSTNFQKSWDIQTNTLPNFMKVMLKPVPGVLPPDVESVFSSYTDAMPDYISFAFGLENTWMYGAQLTQPLFLGGAGIAGVQMAYAGKDAAYNRLKSDKQNLIYMTANAYFGCLLSKQVIEVQEEALKQAEANFDLVLKKYQVGSASGFDKMRAEVELANLKPDVISARNAYKSAMTRLRSLAGLDNDVKIQVQGELTYQDDPFNDASLDSLKQTAFLKRPEIQSLQAQKTIASKGITMARSRFMPKVFFQTNYSFLAMRNDYDFVKDDFSKGFTSAVSVQIPIFHGLKHCKQYQKAQLDYKITMDMEKQLLDGIAADVEVSFNGFGEAREKWVAAQESITLAKEALRLANLMYEEGAITQLDVLGTQLALTRARLNHASSLYEYQQSRYNLRRAVGVLDGVLDQ